MNVIVDIVFLIDIIMTFFTSYQNEDETHEFTDLKSIAIRYLKTWFFVDLISILPLEYFSLDSSLVQSN